MKSKLKKIAGAIIAAMFLALLFAGIVPTPASAHALNPEASCYTRTCDGLFPQASGCTAGAQPYISKEIDKVKVNLMYSPTCNAFFVWLLDSPIVQYLGANIQRTNPPASYTTDNGRKTTYLYSQMVGYTGSEIFANLGIGDRGYKRALDYNP